MPPITTECLFYNYKAMEAQVRMSSALAAHAAALLSNKISAALVGASTVHPSHNVIYRQAKVTGTPSSQLTPVLTTPVMALTMVK